MTTQALLQRLRRRRQRRGAAMVEGAIIAMMMVILLACMWAALSYERSKLKVMDEARTAAWQKALQSCAGDGDSVLTDLGNSSADSGSGSPPSTSDSDPFISLPSLDVFKSAGYANVDLTKPVTFPGVIGGQTHVMHGKMYMRCNEPKKNDDGEMYFKIVLAAGVALYAILAI